MFKIYSMAKLLAEMPASFLGQTTPQSYIAVNTQDRNTSTPYTASSQNKHKGGDSTHQKIMSYIQQLTLLYFSGDSTDDPLSWRVWIWSLMRSSVMLSAGKLLAFLEASS